ncbi:unnamed protein product [Spirodela intermedia]|uniref:ubiquitinyl hydrolase 1 n=1 Tax=Spirodela intermedia TaxID=51605 RepID=A0A7I8ICK7_SPIIN|nr:unnamed protein product [Spirodela intermedia]CAA6655094.1 unnamed protein product [Spirodela intermedia]
MGNCRVGHHYPRVHRKRGLLSKFFRNEAARLHRFGSVGSQRGRKCFCAGVSFPSADGLGFLVGDGGGSQSNGGLLYHEVQESKLCAVHCVNTVLQGPFFSELDLAALASDLDRGERQMMMMETDASQDSYNVSVDGDFSIQVFRHFYHLVPHHPPSDASNGFEQSLIPEDAEKITKPCN